MQRLQIPKYSLYESVRKQEMMLWLMNYRPRQVCIEFRALYVGEGMRWYIAISLISIIIFLFKFGKKKLLELTHNTLLFNEQIPFFIKK